MRQNYVLGFAFNTDRNKVVLIKKTRPAWQAGKLNGLGGKIEGDEQPVDAMVREFCEECGVDTLPTDWQMFTKLIALDGEVSCYRLFDDKILSAMTEEDQKIVIQDISFDYLAQHGLPNILWLIGVALDHNQPHFFVEAHYNQEFSTGKTGT